YMVDKDDHEQVVASEIFAKTKDGKKTIKLTDTPDIHEMYPEWSPKGDEIVFSSNDGNIYLMRIKVN
ncbi:hypothetical protein JEZ13_12510, partial [bacterium]|nr:hypothetical protein [bacterium]